MCSSEADIMMLLTDSGDLYSFNTESKIIKPMNRGVFPELKGPYTLA